MPVSGEEKGLLGSRYYSDHPVFPLESTVADLNIDMIGRTDSAHAGGAPYVYVIGSDRLSSGPARGQRGGEQQRTASWNWITRSMRRTTPTVSTTAATTTISRGKVCRASSTSVVCTRITTSPVMMWRRSSSTCCEQRTLLVFHTAWELANREERIVVDKPVEPARP